MRRILSYMQSIIFVSVFILACEKPKSISGPYLEPEHTNDSPLSYEEANVENNATIQQDKKETWISSTKNKIACDKFRNTYKFADNGDLEIGNGLFTIKCKLWEVNRDNQAYYYVENNIKDCVKEAYLITNAPNVIARFFSGYVIENGELYEVESSEEYENYKYSWFDNNGYRNSKGEWIVSSNIDWPTDPYFYRPISMVDFSKPKIFIGKLK